MENLKNKNNKISPTSQVILERRPAPHGNKDVESNLLELEPVGYTITLAPTEVQPKSHYSKRVTYHP
jgi:hypothetical protein